METKVLDAVNKLGYANKVGRMSALVSDYDYCQFCSPIGNGKYLFFELDIVYLCDEGNTYVCNLFDEEINSFDTEQLILDYSSGKKEAVKLFSDDDNWNIKEIVLNDEGNDTEQIRDLLYNYGYVDFEIDSMIERRKETAKYMAAKELFYQWVNGGE